jgi:2-oxoglutarate dehydrogenase E1 component
VIDMSDLEAIFGPNSGYVRELYRLFLIDESLVGDQWSSYFRSLNGHAPRSDGAVSSFISQHAAVAMTTAVFDRGFLTSRAQRFLDSIRQFGHLAAKINPLTEGVLTPPVPESIVVDTYGFSEEELSVSVPCDGMLGKRELPLRELIAETKKRYQGAVGFEYWHIHHDVERLWIRERIEESSALFTATTAEQEHRLQKLIEAEQLEAGLHTRYIGAKRFSLEGGETLIPMLTTLLSHGARTGVEEVVFGMAHRGRLNVLANVCGKKLEDLFEEFEDKTAATVVGHGDVKYHFGFIGNVEVLGGGNVKTRLCPNPSHLEFVNPVVAGTARALQNYLHNSVSTKVLPILIHGDAAMIGQGVVTETLNFSQVDGYSCGGTIHFVINNQLGFTSTADEARSSTYATDFAKGLGIPVFHINSEAVDQACEVVKLACDYRQQFHKDVVVDLVCYRKYGHNEGDDPTFTQPRMYASIKNKRSLSEQYNELLVSAQAVEPALYQTLEDRYISSFNAIREEMGDVQVGDACGLSGRLTCAQSETLETGVPQNVLEQIAQSLIEVPESFVFHPKLKRQIERRIAALKEGGSLEWGFAEALAFGSLLLEGIDIRLSGQDSCRGTFSHRHIVYDSYNISGDFNQDSRYFPLRQLNSATRFEVYNSTLSETGVMGLEYGYAGIAKHALVLWEAQFGDFANGAQVIIDQFLAASESKWNERSGLVLLLPHGYEGQGPEHSSARLERFLQLCAESNMTVCYPSTSGQYFHMLRRQALTEVKRPLIVMTPKSLLRLPEASSLPNQIITGRFSNVIELDCTQGEPSQTVILCTGKVYYDLLRGIEEKDAFGATVVRLEQLYPFPLKEITRIFNHLRPKNIIWVQEEPQNMGAWTFVEPHIRALSGVSPRYIGRPESPTTATGSPKFHLKEQSKIVQDVVEQIESTRQTALVKKTTKRK